VLARHATAVATARPIRKQFASLFIINLVQDSRIQRQFTIEYSARPAVKSLL